MSCDNTPTTCMFAGDDLRYLVDVRDQSGALVDITDAAEIRFAIVRQLGGVPIRTASLTGADVVIDGDSKFYVDLVPADTAGEQGAYRVEADMVNPDGDTYTILQGRIQILPVQLT